MVGASKRIDLVFICDHIAPMIHPSPRPTDHSTAAHDRVYRALRTRIMHGEFRPGEALTLRGIGKMFDVSMTPAREAVRRLVADGGLNLSASGRVTTPELSNERIEELAAIRALIEPELASRALPRAHIALIDRLQAINSTIAEAVAKHDDVGYIRTNLEFHRTLYLRAQAPAMLALTETVWLQLGPTMRALYARLNRTEVPHNHRLIVAALRAGDEPGLRLAVRSDVTQGLRMLAV
jgi:Transcriptional regulators